MQWQHLVRMRSTARPRVTNTSAAVGKRGQSSTADESRREGKRAIERADRNGGDAQAGEETGRVGLNRAEEEEEEEVHTRRLEVSPQFVLSLQLWLPQFRQLKQQRDREKNWSPFEWEGALAILSWDSAIARGPQLLASDDSALLHANH